jgi:thiamine-monophosphate kinase
MALFKALKPDARYNEGHILRELNTDENRITATDITDGLASEFYEILNSDKREYQFNINQPNNNQFNNDSNGSYSKGIRIYEDKLPVEDEFKEIANVLGLNYLDLFLHVGEDFEFLFTINKELKDQLENELNFYVIGEITEKNTVEIVLSNGTIEKISSEGYQHLK